MIKIFRYSWEILTRQQKNRFILLVVFDILISVADILALIVLLGIIQFYIEPSSSQWHNYLPAWLANRESVWLIGIYFAGFTLKNLLAYFLEKAHYEFNSRVAIRLSRNNLEKFQHSAFRDFVEQDSSLHIRSICLQPFEFCQYILSGIQQIITQTCLVSIAVLAILVFNPQLFLLLLLILFPPVIIVFYTIRKKMSKARRDIRIYNQQSYQYVLDALKGYVESNVYDRNEFFLQRFLRVRKKFSESLFDTLLIQSMPARTIEVFAILGLFILIVVTQWSGLNNNSFLITIGAFMAAAYKIIPGIVKITNTAGQMKAYEFSPDEFTNKPSFSFAGKNSDPPAIEYLKLKNIEFRFSDTPVLKNVNFSIHKNDFAGICGVSGKGKTTILNIILGFLEPNTGEVYINGSLLNADQRKAFWPRIAYVRQQSFFIHDTLLKNITLQEEGFNQPRLEYAIYASGLNDFIDQQPEGIYTRIMENGKNISGGQQQRIAIARALYKDADLLLLDEPFNELDEASERKLLEHFQELSQSGKLVVIITHNKNSLSYCNKIISLDGQRTGFSHIDAGFSRK